MGGRRRLKKSVCLKVLEVEARREGKGREGKVSSETREEEMSEEGGNPRSSLESCGQAKVAVSVRRPYLRDEKEKDSQLELQGVRGNEKESEADQRRWRRRFRGWL